MKKMTGFALIGFISFQAALRRAVKHIGRVMNDAKVRKKKSPPGLSQTEAALVVG
jgi:hypothetical protein